MPLTEANRQKIIDALIEDWLESAIAEDGEELLKALLRVGFKGYRNYSDADLIEEAEHNVDWILEELET